MLTQLTASDDITEIRCRFGFFGGVIVLRSELMVIAPVSRLSGTLRPKKPERSRRDLLADIRHVRPIKLDVEVLVVCVSEYHADCLWLVRAEKRGYCRGASVGEV